MSGSRKLLIGAAVVAAVVLVVLQKWQWLLYGALLACPLMHLFMHGGHGHGGRHNHAEHNKEGQHNKDGQHTHHDGGSRPDAHAGHRHGGRSCH